MMVRNNSRRLRQLLKLLYDHDAITFEDPLVLSWVLDTMRLAIKGEKFEMPDDAKSIENKKSWVSGRYRPADPEAEELIV